MSDGGGAESKSGGLNTSIVRSSSSNYGRAISSIAVAQICESIGFEGFNESALDSLADIAIRYISDLCKTSKFYANLAGRTEGNVFDVIQGLEDMGLQQGFNGDCVVNSGAIREIKDYVEIADEIPFAQPVPQFPVIRQLSTIPSFLEMGETPSFKHIPAWLPAFPDPHTYIRTPVWNERVSDARTDKIELARQNRKAERSLLILQQRLVGGTSAAPDCGTNGLLVNKENPAGEREPSPINILGEAKHVSLLETFAPAIEAMKDGLDSGSDGEMILPKKRGTVFLELKGGRKVFGEPLDLRIRNKGSGRSAQWFGREDEKDDKKRRVEFILRQSMENQQELSQL